MSVFRVYSLTFQAATIANASGDYDLFEIDPADQKPVALHELHLGQTSELGDAAEEELRIAIVKGHTTGGNGTSTTARPMATGQVACSAACETVATTIASAGTAITLGEYVWNVRVPLQIIWTPECRPTCSTAAAGEVIVVRMMSTVTDDITMSGTLVFSEWF